MAENGNDRDASTATGSGDAADYGGIHSPLDDENRQKAAITATGEDIDNDHADERPVDRSQEADATRQQQTAEQDFPDQHEQQRDGQFDPQE